MANTITTISRLTEVQFSATGDTYALRGKYTYDDTTGALAAVSGTLTRNGAQAGYVSSSTQGGQLRLSVGGVAPDDLAAASAYAAETVALVKGQIPLPDDTGDDTGDDAQDDTPDDAPDDAQDDTQDTQDGGEEAAGQE